MGTINANGGGGRTERQNMMRLLADKRRTSEEMDDYMRRDATRRGVAITRVNSTRTTWCVSGWEW